MDCHVAWQWNTIRTTLKTVRRTVVKLRVLGKTYVKVSEIGLGAWQLGAGWGEVTEDEVMQILKTAAERGVTFIDTADVYGLGRSENLIGRFLKDWPERIFVATKLGRYPEPSWPYNFSKANFVHHTEASIKRLGVEAIFLTQLHCIPTAELERGEVFEWLRELQKEGKILHWGASVDSMDQALLCLEQNGLSSLQIIFNIFRQKPLWTLFQKAREKNVALIVRLPLASGLLAGTIDKDTVFPETDHRNYNRNGEVFNIGETFAGLPFEKGVELADALTPFVPAGMTPAQMALRWILDYPEVSVVIPGATNHGQVDSDVRANDLPPLSEELHRTLEIFYKENVEAFIRGAY
jgi:aryl-alcohol dehydrogenase-like predicted oxidoreductase